tara:strand:+ start:361 stop:525 length:165 start_codon:yes stop_codon:yes gene_type:complete
LRPGGEASRLIDEPRELRPGDTVVLPFDAEGSDVFGHISEDATKDIAEPAYRAS